MIHRENNVLTDDELVIVRNFLRTPKHACLYITVYEVIIFLSEPKKTHLTSLYLDHSNTYICFSIMFFFHNTDCFFYCY